MTTDQTVSIDGVDYANDGLWERHDVGTGQVDGVDYANDSLWERHDAGTGQVRHARRNTRSTSGAHALELGRPGYRETPVLQNADPKLVYAAQVRGARALLGWSQGDLAERAGISKQTVNRIESGNMDARFSTVSALGEAFRGAGVEMNVHATGVTRTVFVVSVPNQRL